MYLQTCGLLKKGTTIDGISRIAARHQRLALLFVMKTMMGLQRLCAGGSTLAEAFVNSGLALLNYMTPLKAAEVQDGVQRSG